MNIKPEALRLADAIDPLTRKTLDNLTCAVAAAELRRLYAEVDRLSYQLAYPDNFVKESKQETLTFDGLTAQEFVLKELYAFQEATGCDTADQIKARKPLTDEEIMDLCRSLPTTQYTTAFARALEAAHGIKGDA